MDKTIAQVMTLDVQFDCAMANAEAWQRDAQLYTGKRRQIRLDHAARMEFIAEGIVKETAHA